ncbi:hypothetical protein B9Z19DRAFT_1078844 [Tuber borchii]|uniref:Uncharacterized protein n=1 Tax=Tuber borchii TaxID=42251 RepID=A0A2T6ZZ37_TUBBO|nr:hypothetical protein B9Z19DRAFT_1078844 [Tuber borchii]
MERKGKEAGVERGASQSEIRACNKLHPPFHPSLHLHPSINQPTAKACCLFHFPPSCKATSLCRASTAGLGYSFPHSPTHLLTYSPTHSLTHLLNSYMFQDRVVWGVKG